MHIPHHIGPGLTHGSPIGISQLGIDASRGYRVWIDPARGRGEGTEVRNLPASSLSSVSSIPGPGGSSGQYTTRLLDSGLPWDEILDAGVDRVADWITGGGGGGGGTNIFDECVWPWRRDPISGTCKAFVGDQPGREKGGVGGGQAVVGGFNMPAFVPDVVGNISRQDGSSGPILRCPTGTVLATDNLCYAKGTKGLAAHRKWKPTPPGFLPRADVKCLRRSVAIKKNKSNRAMFKELGLG